MMGHDVRERATRWRRRLERALERAGDKRPLRGVVRLVGSAVAALGGDLQARRELEAALANQKRTAQELAESEARFREVFLRTPNPLAIARVSDAFIYDVNDAFAQKAGYTREQILNGGASDLPWWPEAEGERILGLLREQGSLRDAEVRVIDGDGDERVILVSASPIMMHGEACVVWQTVDVTDLRRADETRAALEAQLREKTSLARLGTLAGGIAHDFNNLLVGILGNADLVLYRLPADSPLRAPMEAVVLSAQRAAEHTCELLDYAGRNGTQLRPIRLDLLIIEVIALAVPFVHVKPGLHWTSPGEPTWIQGDAGQLTRMLINLIKNSAESLEGTAGEARLSVEVVSHASQVSVRIRDNGRGMDESTRNRMFEPFFSTKRSGCGLGLASVPAIVARHAGQMEIESSVGQGTTISMEFPRIAQPEAHTTPKLVEPPRATGRVLLVDDEPAVLSTASAMLRHLGYDVVEANSGGRALELVSNEGQDLLIVVLDATMPGLNGAQTLERLRVLRPDLPVLLCSGYSQTDFNQVLMGQPHVAFLTKPCRAEELSAAIQALLSETSSNLASVSARFQTRP